MKLVCILLIMVTITSRLCGQTSVLVQPGTMVYPIIINPVSHQLVFGNLSSIKMLDWEKGQLCSINLSGMQSGAVSLDGNLSVFVSVQDNISKIVFYDAISDKTKEFVINDEISNVVISHNNQYAAFESNSNIYVYKVQTISKISVIDKLRKRNGSCTFKGDTLVIAEKGSLQLFNAPLFKVGKPITFKGDFQKFSPDGFNYFVSIDNQTLAYNNGTNNLSGKVELKKQWIPMPFDNLPAVSPDGKRIAIFYNYGKMSLGIHDLSTGKPLSSIDLSKQIPDMSSQVRIDPSWKLFAFSNNTNGITLYNLQTDKEICQVYSIGSNDILITIPDGHYMATRRGALEGIAFENDGHIYNFDQFDLRYNRPDLVLKHINLTPPDVIETWHKAWLKRLQMLGLTEESLSKRDIYNVPEVKIETDLPIFTDNGNLKIPIWAEDSKSVLNSIHIWVNGIPLFGKNGFSINKQQLKTIKQIIEITLIPGDNVIEVQAINQKGYRSLRIQHTIRYEGPPVKPDLYLVAIGVSKYKEMQKNLRFAADDARGLASFFNKNRTMYNKIYIDTLIDDAFSKFTLKKIKAQLLRSKTNDQVIVFFAGHGLVDDQLDYYMGTSNVLFNQPSIGGIPYLSVESLFDSIPARNRLMLIDACFSGEIDKKNAKKTQMENTVQGKVVLRSSDMGLTPGNTENERIYNMMRQWFVDLRAGSGATILSGASNFQPALEGEKWQSGVFTWCLLNGLLNRGADKNKDGNIMVSELQQYLEEEVPKQSDGRQTPTFRTENLSNDWLIYKYEK
jgi:WD40 repeat protein